MEVEMWNIKRIRKWSFTPGTIVVVLVLLILGAVSVSVRALTLVSETTWGGADSEVTEGVATASDGSIYVAGTTRSFGSRPSAPVIFLLKFEVDGTLAWQRTWEGPGDFANHEARDVAVDSDGSAYVTGSTTGIAGDAVLLKFAPDGTLAWQRTWGGSGTESGQGVAVGPDGVVYVTGSTSSFGAGSGDIFAIKFASDGTLVWQKTWGTSEGEGGDGVAVAQDGSIYVAGVGPRSGAIGGANVVLLKIDSIGNLVWQRTYAAGEIVDARGGVTVAPDDSVYVAGTLQEVKSNSVVVDAILLKFTPGGSLEWDRGWGGRDGDEAGGVAVASDGTVFLVGSTASFGVAPDDAFLVQLQPNGKATDAMTWGGAGLDKGNGVGIVPDGTIFLAGTAEAPPYSFLDAATKTSKLKGSLATPVVALVDAAGTVGDPAGVVSTPDGSLTFAGGFDAALVRITP